MGKTRTRRPLYVFFGLGYTARALLSQMAGDGRFVATSRHIQHKEDRLIAGKHVTFYPFSSVPDSIFPCATHILSSVPPSESGDAVLRRYGASFSAYCSHCWYGYLSTVGVYGDYGGAWVDEESPLLTTQTRGRRRIIAEKAWQALAEMSCHVSIIRLPGIYGIGRCLFDRMINGTLRHLVKEGHVFSRIHVEDAARGILVLMHGERRQIIYNLCDDEPSESSHVLRYACRLAGVPVPPPEHVERAEKEGTLHPLTAQFYQGCRRVSNRRLKEEMNFSLRYPHYRAGLHALYAYHYRNRLTPMA
ncbi:MAG: SDR family NAD(P)-dependent oxidoreductase [Alphaproteobacteria bacterium GM7ARS4]|nr:SDR family NAD(P)-dependent oxidoreductase [Alphaproteobacteria bacterium GM7ARS4]